MVRIQITQTVNRCKCGSTPTTQKLSHKYFNGSSIIDIHMVLLKCVPCKKLVGMQSEDKNEAEFLAVDEWNIASQV
jgi:hypothetical protein